MRETINKNKMVRKAKKKQCVKRIREYHCGWVNFNNQGRSSVALYIT